MDRCYWLRSGDWVAGLCVLHVVRSDLRLGQQFWAADGDFLRDEDKGTGSKCFLLVGKRPVQRGLRALGRRQGKDRLTVF